MNEFREWLSDNLRYFMLGFAIILAIVLLFFGARFISKALGGGEQKDASKKTETTAAPTEEPKLTETPTEEPTPTEAPTEEPTATPTEEPTATPTEEPTATPTEAPNEEPTAAPTAKPTAAPEAKLEKDSNEKAAAVVRSYYSALGKRDVKALARILDKLEDSEAAKIEKEKTIESYQVLSVYTKKGPADGSYAVLAEFEYKLKGVDTQVPSLSALFVKTDAAGKLYIATEKLSKEEQSFFDETVASADARKLVADVTEKNKKAVASDKKLQDALAKISE